MGRHEDAIADYDRLRDLGKINADRIVPYVETLLAAGRVDDAKQQALDYLKSNPDVSPDLKTALRRLLAPHLRP